MFQTVDAPARQGWVARWVFLPFGVTGTRGRQGLRHACCRHPQIASGGEVATQTDSQDEGGAKSRKSSKQERHRFDWRLLMPLFRTPHDPGGDRAAKAPRAKYSN